MNNSCIQKTAFNNMVTVIGRACFVGANAINWFKTSNSIKIVKVTVIEQILLWNHASQSLFKKAANVFLSLRHKQHACYQVIFLYSAEEIDGKWHKIVHDIFIKFAGAKRFFWKILQIYIRKLCLFNLSWVNQSNNPLTLYVQIIQTFTIHIFKECVHK